MRTQRGQRGMTLVEIMISLFLIGMMMTMAWTTINSSSNARNGFVAFVDVPGRPVARFTQADLEGGRVSFMHDGSATPSASFDIVVADRSGATSGAPQTVKVAVRQ